MNKRYLNIKKIKTVIGILLSITLITIPHSSGKVRVNSNYILSPQNDFIITEGVRFLISWDVNDTLNLTYYYIIDSVPSAKTNVSNGLIEILYPNIGEHSTIGTHQLIPYVSDFTNETDTDLVIVTIIKAYTNREDFDPYSNRSTTEPQDSPWNLGFVLLGITIISYVLKQLDKRRKEY